MHMRSVVISILCGLLALALGAVSVPPPRLAPTAMPARDVARARWDRAAIHSYDLTVAVEVRGHACIQHVQVRYEAAIPLRDTCHVPWLGILSVPQIFDVADQVAALPLVRCQPSVQDCLCQRSFSVRDLVFDPHTSVPRSLYSRSAVAPNIANQQFWREILLTRAFPQCAADPRVLAIRVVSFVPRIEAGESVGVR
jgi:hypothetical protein